MPPKTTNNLPSIEKSKKLSLICICVTTAIMIICRPIFRLKAETTFLGGLVGAVLYFFLLIYAGNRSAGRSNHGQIGWLQIIICEIIALIISTIVHPVCVTTCFLFSIPVVIYIKWAATKMAQAAKSQ